LENGGLSAKKCLMVIDEKLIAEAQEEIKPHDAQGDMAAKINRLGEVANAVRQFAVDFVDRKSLSVIVIGDDENAIGALTAAYAKALKGYGFISAGMDDKPAVHSIDWSTELADICATREMKEQSWAAAKMEEAGTKARDGVLVIGDIHKRPYAGYPDEEEATPSAETGGLEVLRGFMGDKSQEDGTPIVVLTGPKAGIVEFFQNHPEMKGLFNAVALRAGPPLRITTELETPITVKSPLKLVIPSTARFA
jgi:hypothetical protein